MNEGKQIGSFDFLLLITRIHRCKSTRVVLWQCWLLSSEVLADTITGGSHFRSSLLAMLAANICSFCGMARNDTFLARNATIPMWLSIEASANAVFFAAMKVGKESVVKQMKAGTERLQWAQKYTLWYWQYWNFRNCSEISDFWFSLKKWLKYQQCALVF